MRCRCDARAAAAAFARSSTRRLQPSGIPAGRWRGGCPQYKVGGKPGMRSRVSHSVTGSQTAVNEALPADQAPTGRGSPGRRRRDGEGGYPPCRGDGSCTRWE